MPFPTDRKKSHVAQRRIQQKYVLVDKDVHPHKLYPPLKKATAELRSLVETKNYIRIMTNIWGNCYIITQWYVYCDEDLWMCGDSIVLNANPQKAILVNAICVKTRS
ncbi:hypothetical protein MEO43_25370, partial [Dolichospermum sp. ST_sed5]|nr:hypothetical protein [Dolichospermum sp. ST_sed5]